MDRSTTHSARARNARDVTSIQLRSLFSYKVFAQRRHGNASQKYKKKINVYKRKNAAKKTSAVQDRSRELLRAFEELSLLT